MKAVYCHFNDIVHIDKCDTLRCFFSQIILTHLHKHCFHLTKVNTRFILVRSFRHRPSLYPFSYIISFYIL